METSSFTPKTDDESSFNEILILETVSCVAGVGHSNNPVEIPVIFSINNVFSKLKGLGLQDFEGEQFNLQGLGLQDFEGEQFNQIADLLNGKADDVEADSPDGDDSLCDDHDGTHWNMCDSLNDWMYFALKVLMGAFFVVFSFLCLQSVYNIVMNKTPQEIGKFINTMETQIYPKLTQIDEIMNSLKTDIESSENDSNEDDFINEDDFMSMMTGTIDRMTEGVAPDSSDAISDKIDLSSSSDPNDSFSDTSMIPNIPKQLMDIMDMLSGTGYGVLGDQFKLANEPMTSDSEITEIAKPSEIAFGAWWDSLKPFVYKKFIDLI